MMSNAKVLVGKCLIQPVRIKCVRVMPALEVDLNFKPPSWLWWMKLFEMAWNWSLSPITFLISLPNVFKRMMGLKDFNES